MIFPLVGPPTSFAIWTELVLLRLIDRARGPAAVVTADYAGEIAAWAFRKSGYHLIAAARQPSGDMRSALLATGSRFVLTLDDPRAALWTLVVRRGLDWRAALRSAACSCAAMLTYLDMPGALLLRAERGGGDQLRAAAALADWFGLAVAPAEIAVVVETLADGASAARDDDWVAWWDQLPVGDRAVADGVLGGFNEAFLGGSVGKFAWSRDLLFLGDDPSAAADRIIDIRGPVRYLFFGPYIALPPGQWGATVVLAASGGAETQNYNVEVVAGSRFVFLGRGVVHPFGEGLCETTIGFAVSETTDQPIELRIANSQPAVAGRLALALITLEPRARIPADFVTSLGL
jgi:hypothetical protein